jgi:hypothetical protein
VTIAGPDILARLLERELSRTYILQTASSETIPAVNQTRVELNPGRRTLGIWVFVADITDDLILGLYTLRAYYSSLDIGRRVL